MPWKRVAPGVETAPASELGGDPAWSARVVLADPAKARLLVRYDAARPTLAEWRKRYPNAIAIVNGSFYSRDGAEVRPTCELVSDGLRVRGAGCQRQDALYFGSIPRPRDPPLTPMVSRAPDPISSPRFLAPSEFRAEEWTEAMERWCRRHEVGSFHGWCRVHGAEIRRLRGRLADAESEA
ncbi:MAG TPA: hypothetical protein VE755_09790, partial [Myxococcales bacterium]|nr:hypothetical protein [Myxococcales bacterium]